MSGDMIFYPAWKKHEFRKIGSSSERVAWFFFESQSDTFARIKELVPDLQSFFLTPHFVESKQKAICEVKRFDRIIFVSETTWSYDPHYEMYSDFLDFLKIVQQVGCVKLDIVTVKSIVCPSYGAVVHPLDSVFVGLGQTFAQEVDFPVRVLVLEHISDESVYWIMHGDFPKRCPIVIRNAHFLTPTLKRNGIYDHMLDSDQVSAFRNNGVYLIIGGNGGLGGMIAKYLASKYHANLILVGRSSKNEKQIDFLVRVGATSVKYEQLDISDLEEVKNLFKKYPVINGVIHSALVLKDSLIINMSQESLLNVLSPKLQGTLNLLRVLKDKNCHQLDFLLFFSSVQSYIANPGQANYTAACVAKDALASDLNDLYMLNAKIINWSFWGEIGIVASEYYRKRMSRLGIDSIKEEEGLKIIEWFLSNKLRQITVIKASNEALKRLNIGA